MSAKKALSFWGTLSGGTAATSLHVCLLAILHWWYWSSEVQLYNYVIHYVTKYSQPQLIYELYFVRLEFQSNNHLGLWWKPAPSFFLQSTSKISHLWSTVFSLHKIMSTILYTIYHHQVSWQSSLLASQISHTPCIHQVQQCQCALQFKQKIWQPSPSTMYSITTKSSWVFVAIMVLEVSVSFCAPVTERIEICNMRTFLQGIVWPTVSAPLWLSCWTSIVFSLFHRWECLLLAHSPWSTMRTSSKGNQVVSEVWGA